MGTDLGQEDRTPIEGHRYIQLETDQEENRPESGAGMDSNPLKENRVVSDSLRPSGF